MSNDTIKKIRDVLDGCGAWSNDSAWQVQGTWCIKHKALEIVAVAKNIAFEPPTIIENNSLERVSLIVTGEMDGRREWSIGECSVQNYKAFDNAKMAAYPWAMAEKRAKDRVILKLVGLHGYAYSEDESDAFKDAPQETSATGYDPTKIAAGLVAEIGACASLAEMKTLFGQTAFKRAFNGLPDDQKERVLTEKDRTKPRLESSQTINA